MHTSITRVVVAVAAGAALGATGASAPGAATRAAETAGLSAGMASGPAASPGAQLWVKRYTSPGKGFDVARSVAVSPNGRTVFVTGYGAGVTSGEDYITVAYSAASGAQLWASRYTGPGNGTDEAHLVAVSPTGRTVYVTGTSPGASEHDYATVAYNAATGAQLWVKRYNGPGNSYDDAASVTVSPTGRAVFVTGLSAGATSGFDYATVAYSAATGARLWAARYNGPGNGYDEARSIAASPNGHTVLVTGSSNRLISGVDPGFDYATVAYNAATGAQLWVKRYNGVANDYDAAAALAVSRGGGTVFVTGTSAGATSGLDYATLAYRTSTGARLWVKRYNGPGNNLDGAESVALSPGGGTVFVTGTSVGATSSLDYATLAYRTSTGARLWVKRYNGPGNGYDVARSVAVSPNGKTVYVTGGSDGATSRRDYATAAYNAATGTLLWLKRYNGPGNNWDFAFSMAVSPAGRRVFITGESVGATTHWDYATIAYHG